MNKSLLLFTAAMSVTMVFGFEPKEGKTEKVGNRDVVWFEHGPDAAWGAQGNYTDKFTVAKPEGGDKANAPLIVQLHSRGGGMPQGGIMSQYKCCGAKEGVYRTLPEAYVLALDSTRDQNVQANKTNPEFWWGATPKYSGPAKSDVPRLRKGETPCAKRVLDTIEWVAKTYKVDRNRIYLMGNSMGGQGTLAIGLPHGEIFAAIEANVPATIWYVAATMDFVDDQGKAIESSKTFVDPPVCLDWSGSNDVWSRDHEILAAAMAARKYNYQLLWGDYGHCGDWNSARAKNDLIGRFDIFSIVKNAAYPVFTNASSDDQLPWPWAEFKPDVNNWGGWAGDIKGSSKIVLAAGAPAAGQRNGFFRWENVKDVPQGLKMKLWIASAAELGGCKVTPPESATADVTLRRIQSVKLKPGRTVQWKFGAQKGKVKVGEDGLVTLPQLQLSQQKTELALKY